MEARRAHNPEVVGSSPASATIKTPDFEGNPVFFLTFWRKMERSKMPWGIATGIVPKYAISKNREFQTFFGVSLFIFPGISLKKIG